MTAWGCSRSITPSSCGLAKSVLSSSTDAPSLAQAKTASTKPRWLRHMTATEESAVDAVLAERPGERVRAALELAERELAELVDQRDVVPAGGPPWR